MRPVTQWLLLAGSTKNLHYYVASTLRTQVKKAVNLVVKKTQVHLNTNKIALALRVNIVKQGELKKVKVDGNTRNC